MTHIMKMRWGMYKDELRKILSERTGLNDCSYEDLVKITFETIYNSYEESDHDKLDLDAITVIDNGDYQGTLLFVIPYKCYQPSESEHIMTYIGYGSCSGCDALEAAKDWSGIEKLTEQQISDFMNICKDLVCNAIKPYNNGWREDEGWLPAKDEE